MTYDELKTAVADFLNRDDLTSVVPTFIALAEAELQRLLRVREMLRNAQTTTSSVSVSLPGDFLELRHVVLSDENLPLFQASFAELDDIRRHTRVSARPTHVAVYKDKLEFAPIPDGDYLIEIIYYQLIPTLSSTNSTNWLSAAHPDVYLYGALTKAAPYIGEDERTEFWRREYLTGVQQLNTNATRAADKGMRKSLAFRAF